METKWDLKYDYILIYVCIKVVCKIIRQYHSHPDTKIQLRWEVFRACLNTYGGFGLYVWTLLPFGGICMQYDDYKDTNDTDEI